MKLHEINGDIPFLWQLLLKHNRAGKRIEVDTKGATGVIKFVDTRWVNQTTGEIVTKPPKDSDDHFIQHLHLQFYGELKGNRPDRTERMRVYLLPPSSDQRLTLKSVDGILTLVSKPNLPSASILGQQVLEDESEVPLPISMAMKLGNAGTSVYLLRVNSSFGWKVNRIVSLSPTDRSGNPEDLGIALTYLEVVRGLGSRDQVRQAKFTAPAYQDADGTSYFSLKKVDGYWLLFKNGLEDKVVNLNVGELVARQ